MRFRSLTEVARDLGREFCQDFTPAEVRVLCMYENIRVYSDPRSRARTLDNEGYARLRGIMRKYIDGRKAYYDVVIQPDSGEKRP